MGLDNIPHNYPCRTNGTAVMEPRLNNEGQPILDDDGTPMMAIDCRATQAAGGCPWLNANPPEAGRVIGMRVIGMRVIGMFGTSCWYRGKYGNYLIEKYGEYDETEGYSFYGSDANGAYKSAGECEMLADHLIGLLPTTDPKDDDRPDDFGLEEMDQDEKADIEYAAWWLRWAAKHADGSDCWY